MTRTATIELTAENDDAIAAELTVKISFAPALEDGGKTSVVAGLVADCIHTIKLACDVDNADKLLGH